MKQKLNGICNRKNSVLCEVETDDLYWLDLAKKGMPTLRYEC
jgi:hypothetical protein